MRALALPRACGVYSRFKCKAHYLLDWREIYVEKGDVDGIKVEPLFTHQEELLEGTILSY